MATGHSRSYTIGSHSVFLRWISCNHNEITHTSISGSVRNSGLFGINSTYFRNVSGVGWSLVGIAINSGGEVRRFGTMNRDTRAGYTHVHKCGTMVCPSSSTSGVILFTDVIDRMEGWVYNGETWRIQNIKWAVGGTSLFTGEDSLTQQQYINRISTEDPGGGTTGRAPRTAIIYRGGQFIGENMVLLSVQADSNDDSSTSGGLSFWELRQCIRELFTTPLGTPPIHAIALDGGGSTQIRYRENGVIRSNQVTGNRPVHAMLSVPM